MVRSTSKAAHHDNERTGLHTDQVSIILNAMRDGKLHTCRAIHEATGLELGAVSGRCNRMKADIEDGGYGYLEEGEPMKCPVTDRTVTPVKLRPSMLQRELAL